VLLAVRLLLYVVDHVLASAEAADARRDDLVLVAKHCAKTKT
jgi:hypothetical protein